MDSIIDKLKAAYFATHGSSFPLTGNTDVIFKYNYIPEALSSLFPIVISLTPFDYVSAQFVLRIGRAIKYRPTITCICQDLLYLTYFFVTFPVKMKTRPVTC